MLSGLLYLLFSNNNISKGDHTKRRFSLSEISAMKSVSQNTDAFATQKAGLSKKIQEPAGIENRDLPNSAITTVAPLKILEEYLNQDKICDIAKTAWGLNDRIQILLSAPDVIKVDSEADRTLQALFSENGPLNKNSSKNTDSGEIIIDFFNALLSADLIAGIESKNIDYEKANEILLDLTNRDPANGAYRYFRTVILKKLGVDDETIRKEFLTSFECTKFDTFYNSIAARLLQKSFGSSSHFLLGVVATSEMPIAAMNKPYDLLKYFLLQNQPDFNRMAIDFAHKMMPQKIPENGTYEFFHWSALHYSIGSMIIKHAWNSAYPETPKPEFKPLKDLIIYDDALSSSTTAFENLSTDGGQRKCNRKELDNFVVREKARYLEFLRTF